MIRAIPKCQPVPANVELLTPLARCPRCGRAPNLRITLAERDAAQAQAGDLVKATYGCHARRCDTAYQITAWCYQRAYTRAEPPMAA
jgi:hypothetical protein